jgi:uncharacterized protein YjbI with pentapeptide repeats
MVETYSAYHFTHVNNIATIFKARELRADIGAKPKNNSLDQTIKAKRRTKKVKIAPYGLLGDYVPFYFAPRSPALYQLATGDHQINKTSQNELVFFRLDFRPVADGLVNESLSLISNQHPLKTGALFYTATPESIATRINWKTIKSFRWQDTDEYPNRKSQREAELLIYQRLRLEQINGTKITLATRTNLLQRKIQKMCEENDLDIDVEVQPSYFYDRKSFNEIAGYRIEPYENLEYARLSGKDLTGVNLAGANLAGANLAETNLKGADLSGADLAGANLSAANLTNADLKRANLTGSNFTKANLASARITDAILANTIFDGANLTGPMRILLADNK